MAALPAARVRPRHGLRRHPRPGPARGGAGCRAAGPAPGRHLPHGRHQRVEQPRGQRRPAVGQLPLRGLDAPLHGRVPRPGRRRGWAPCGACSWRSGCCATPGSARWRSTSSRTTRSTPTSSRDPDPSRRSAVGRHSWSRSRAMRSQRSAVGRQPRRPGLPDDLPAVPLVEPHGPGDVSLTTSSTGVRARSARACSTAIGSGGRMPTPRLGARRGSTNSTATAASPDAGSPVPALTTRRPPTRCRPRGVATWPTDGVAAQGDRGWRSSVGRTMKSRSAGKRQGPPTPGSRCGAAAPRGCRQHAGRPEIRARTVSGAGGTREV